MNGGMQPPPTAYRAAAGTGFAAPGTAKAGMRGLASRGGGRPGKCAPVTSQPFVMSKPTDIERECKGIGRQALLKLDRLFKGPGMCSQSPNRVKRPLLQYQKSMQKIADGRTS
jgi:hypothetical protein